MPHLTVKGQGQDQNIELAQKDQEGVLSGKLALRSYLPGKKSLLNMLALTLGMCLFGRTMPHSRLRV